MRIQDFVIRIGRKLVFPFLPKSARLPFNYWLHLFAGSIEPELRHIRAICEKRGIAIDVGANVGMFSYRMARIFSKVYAFEINEGVAADLIAYKSNKIEIVHSGLSSEDRDMILYTPVLKGVPLDGWASLLPGNCPDTQEHITKKVHVRPLDSFSLKDVSFVKIDVEGHELEVLRGAVETISASRPVILVEIKGRNLEQVFGFFKAISYEEISLQGLCGIEGARENHIFAPCNKTD